MFSNTLTRGNALKYLVLFFILSVLIRIPNLDRPLSKHHEFNTAVILMGIESWQQGGGASVLHFVPLLNYQQEGDYSYTRGPNTDSTGNSIYLSFGPGWYVIPYLLFKLFNIPPVALSLQILNLLINALTLFILFLFLERAWKRYPFERKYSAILISCIAFLFSPNILWFLGNGYVCTGIMLPFVLMALMVFVDMFTGARSISFINLSIFILIGIVIIYIDWFGVFLYSSFCLVSLFFIRSNRKMIFVAAASGLSVIAGVGCIVLQFASYTGYEQVFLYWRSRFGERNMLAKTCSLSTMFYNIFAHFLTSYLPIILLLIFLFVNKVIKKGSPLLAIEKVIIAVCLFALIPFNIVLLEWTSKHDFSVIPFSILFTFLAGSLVLRMTSSFNKAILILLFLFISIAQYYFINRPGSVSQNGTPYRSEMDVGNQIRNMSLPPYKLFTNLPVSPIIEYYAKRNLMQVPDKEAARDLVKKFKIDGSVWLEAKNGRIVQAEVIKDY